jgi:hypothetical protein
MGAGSKDSPISSLLVDESFASEDDQFVDHVRMVTAPTYLAAMADRWKKDPRAWARRQIFKYLALPLDRAGHHCVVKRLFKQAEASRDHELMAAFLVAFDRLVRRQRRMRYRYNFQTRWSSQEEVLFAPRDQILATAKGREARNPRTGERIYVPGFLRVPMHGRLFSYRTRGYLRRRACRYFRRMGFQQPSEYPQAVAAALALYRDDDAARGENILDNWSLMHIAFRRSPVLQFKRTRVEVTDGRSLGELAAAPQFENLWKKPESTAVLLKLLTQADSRLVRVWAMQLLKRDHAPTMQAITARQLLALLNHADEEVQQFGAGLLETLSGADSWPIATWLELLETRSVTALATICQVMNQRVSPKRLSLEQCVALACARATPVARLGLSWLRSRPVSGSEDRATIGRLAGVQCEAVGAEVAEYALSILGSPQAYRMEEVSPFFDSLNASVRRGAWEWLTPPSPGYDDAELWSRLLETPYDDVRLRLVEELNKRTRETDGPAALNRQDVSMVWATVLLGVHRGGRAKLKALRQISQAIAEQPDRAARLVPVLAVAIRSVRPPEARAGLSAILSAVSARPELEATLARCIPELRLLPSMEVAP